MTEKVFSTLALFDLYHKFSTFRKNIFLVYPSATQVASREELYCVLVLLFYHIYFIFKVYTLMPKNFSCNNFLIRRLSFFLNLVRTSNEAKRLCGLYKRLSWGAVNLSCVIQGQNFFAFCFFFLSLP